MPQIRTAQAEDEAQIFLRYGQQTQEQKHLLSLPPEASTPCEWTLFRHSEQNWGGEPKNIFFFFFFFTFVELCLKFLKMSKKCLFARCTSSSGMQVYATKYTVLVDTFSTLSIFCISSQIFFFFFFFFSKLCLKICQNVEKCPFAGVLHSQVCIYHQLECPQQVKHYI